MDSNSPCRHRLTQNDIKSSAMSMISSTLSASNNEGVACLDNRNLSDAVHHFGNALDQARIDCESFFAFKDGHAVDFCCNHCSSSATVKSLPFPLYCSIRNKLNPPNTLEESPSLSGPKTKGLVLHSQGFRLPALQKTNECLVYSNNVMHNSSIYSSIIIFNLGLAFHLEGVKAPSSFADVHFQVAKSLYERSVQLLLIATSLATNCSTTGNAEIDVLIMALLNNRAMVQMELGEIEASKITFQQLLHFALSVRKSAECQRCNSPIQRMTERVFMEEQIEKMLTNAAMALLYGDSGSFMISTAGAA